MARIGSPAAGTAIVLATGGEVRDMPHAGRTGNNPAPAFSVCARDPVRID